MKAAVKEGARLDRTLHGLLGGSAGVVVGQLAIFATDGEYALLHRDECGRGGLRLYEGADAAAELARFDDAGDYRPLKTAPNLAHGWRLVVADFDHLRIAVDSFYPGRLAALEKHHAGQLTPVPLRETLARQSGMYRVAATIADAAAADLVSRFCRSDGGCLRTILWRLDEAGRPAGTMLPTNKFEPGIDQAALGRQYSHPELPFMPLLCQEACNLLVAEARKVARAEQP